MGRNESGRDPAGPTAVAGATAAARAGSAAGARTRSSCPEASCPEQRDPAPSLDTLAPGEDLSLSDAEDLGLMRDARPPCQLYLISPPAFDLETHARALERVLVAGGPVAAYQLRLKGVADTAVLAAAERLRPICAAHDVAFILNDRADLAAQAGADGVHLGQGDGSVAKARRWLGHEAQIGVTCHGSRHLAMEAGEAGANYVAFGAFFETATKDVSLTATPAILSWWTLLSPIPCVAIGGITPENCRPLVAAGADFLAVSAAIWSAPDPAAAVQAFACELGRAR